MTDPTERVQQLIQGFRATALLGAAVRSGLIEGFAGASRSPEELAAVANLSTPVVRRVVRGLAVLGLVEESASEGGGTNRYRLTPAGELLRRESSDSLSDFARLCSHQYVPAWMELEGALRRGALPFDAAFGKPVWQWRQENPEESAVFNSWLNGQTSSQMEPLVDALDLVGCRRIADIGAGQGRLLAGVLQRHPGLTGVLADQAHVLNSARSLYQNLELEGRCEFVPTDFFVSVPRECDAYLLKSVLHDWDDQDCVRILERIRDAMPPGARLLVIERLLPRLALDEPSVIWLDLHMLAVTGGRERTLEEYRALLHQSGFGVVRTRTTSIGFSVMEAIAGGANEVGHA